MAKRSKRKVRHKPFDPAEIDAMAEKIEAALFKDFHAMTGSKPIGGDWDHRQTRPMPRGAKTLFVSESDYRRLEHEARDRASYSNPRGRAPLPFSHIFTLPDGVRIVAVPGVPPGTMWAVDGL